MSKVVEINNIGELNHYYLVWNSLLAQTPGGGSFFQSLEWLQSYWRHFGSDQQLRVLVVYSGGRPIGILPLTVIRETTRIGNVRVLTYPLHDWGTEFGPIGPNPTATLTAAMQYLRRSARDWDMMDLRWVTADIDRGRTPTAMQAAGLHARRSVWKETAVVDIRGTWDDYLAGRSSKFRNNLRRAEKKALAVGHVTFERYRPAGAAQGEGDPRWDLYDECVELASRSWQGSSTTGTTLSTLGVRDFLREAHGLAAKTGMVDINILRMDGRAVAYGYNYHHQGAVFGLRVGFDPAWSTASVGTVLWSRSLQDSFDRGDRKYDIGVDSPEIKRSWITRMVPVDRYTHYSMYAPRVQLLRIKHWMVSQPHSTHA